MDISGLTDASGSTLIPGAPTPPPVLGREDFLRLLVTKLANQNPLEPTSDTEFIAQLAQFSSLEQAIQTNANLESLSLGQSSLINAQALNLIGREVLIDTGGELKIEDGKPDELILSLDKPIHGGEVKVYDSSGKLVHTMPLGVKGTGRHTIEWDGKVEVKNGDETDTRQLADGDYTFDVTSFDSDGESETAARILIATKIEGLNFTHGVPILISGGREVPFNEIVEIRDGSGS